MGGEKKETKEIKKYKKLRQRAQSSKDFKQEAACCNALGNAYVNNEEFDKALEMHVEEKRLCDVINDKIGFAVAHRMMGDVYLAKEDFESGIDELEKYLELSTNFPVELQRANTQLGKCLYEYARSCINHPQKSVLLVKSGIQHLVTSVTIAKELQRKHKVDEKEANEMKVRSYINLALSYHHLSLVDLTKYHQQIDDYFLKATTIAKKKHMYDELYLIYHLMSAQSCDFNKCKVSVEKCKIAIEYAKKCSDESNLLEAFVFCGQMMLCAEELEGVKKYWKCAYNMMKPDQRCQLLSKFKAVFKITQLHKKLSTEADVMKVYEKLGDLYCKLEAYRPAVSYYERLQALFDGKKGGEEMRKMEASNLYSLAQTYSDLRQYDQAIHHYLEEIKLRDELKEKSASLLQVALCMEKQNCGDVKKITPHLQQALEYANECDVTKVKVLQVYEEILRRFNRGNEANKIRLEMNKLEDQVQQHNSEGYSEEDDEDDDFDERLFNIELSNIDTSGLVEGRCGRRRGGTFVVVEKKNAKGETPLHQACLSGQHNKVQQLIQMGHSVNTRDHFGWTPLHEACNHGYTDLVKLLLKHGAEVNVTAGDDIVTPMSDAAQNGHFEIVVMLYDAGADPTIANSKGRSTVDILDSYYHREQPQGDEKRSYQSTRHKLTGKVPNSQLPCHKRLLAHDDDDLLDSYRPPDDNDDDVIIDDMKKKTATSTKAAAASGVSKRNTSSTTSIRVTSASTSFTHDVGDYDVTDDFLVDDSTPPRRKKARSSGENRQNGAVVPSTYPRRNLATAMKKASSGPSTQPPMMTSPPPPKWNVEVEGDDVVVIDDDDVMIDKVVEEMTSWVEPTAVVASPPSGGGMKVTLRIDEMTFVIGIPCKTKTMEWLNERAVSCYKEATSISAKIALTTEDHSLLSNHDVISDVLSCGDVIIGHVKSHDAKTLVESYRDKCGELHSDIVGVIVNSCKKCDGNRSMNLANYSFGYHQHLKPLIYAISSQPLITEINFSGNRLGTDGIKRLCESMMTSSSLRHHSKSSLVTLNVKCCQLNSACLLLLAKCSYFNQVEKLDISHNDLSSENGMEIYELLDSWKKLRNLNMADCNVNMKKMLHITNIQSVFINLPDLERFDVSDNLLDIDDVTRLFVLLRHNSKLKWLNLNSTITSQYNQFIDVLLEFLKEKNDDNLSYLNLKHNGLDDDHMNRIRSNETFKQVSHLLL